MSEKTRPEYKQDLTRILGLDSPNDLPTAYSSLFDVESPYRMGLILQIAEQAATVISNDIVAINADGPRKLHAIREIALVHKNSKNKQAATIANAILEVLVSNDEEDDGHWAEYEDHVPLSEENVTAQLIVETEEEANVSIN